MFKKFFILYFLSVIQCVCASDGRPSLHLDESCALVSVLHRSCSQEEVLKQKYKALLMCDITPKGRGCIAQCRGIDFHVLLGRYEGLQKNESLKREYISLDDEDALSFNGSKVILDLSDGTLDRIKAVGEDFYIRLQGAIENEMAFKLWGLEPKVPVLSLVEQLKSILDLNT